MESGRVNIEETLQRISSKKGVKKVLILTREGQLIQSEPQNEENSKQAKQFSNLAKSIDSTLLEVDPQDGMTFMRLRTQKHEIMLAPDQEYLLVVFKGVEEE